MNRCAFQVLCNSYCRYWNYEKRELESWHDFCKNCQYYQCPEASRIESKRLSEIDIKIKNHQDDD